MEKKDPNLLSVEDVREHCKLIRRSVETKEVQYFHAFNLNMRIIFIHPLDRTGYNCPFFPRLASCSGCCAPCQ